MPIGVNFRATAGYVTDPTGFVAQTDYTLYSPSRGYGYLATPTGSSGVRNRTTGLDPQLAGIHFSNAAFKFRIDLPNGPGRYRLRAVHHDEYDNPTGYRYWDGQKGQELAYIAGNSYDDSYQTILGNHPAKAQFSQTKEDYIEHVFESDHIIVERDVYLTSGLGIISSVWVEHITSTSHEGLGGEHLWVCPSISNSKDDISGHNITTTLNGGMSIVSDATNGGSKAFAFDGTDDYVSTNMQGELDFFQRKGVWSVAAWVKCDDGGSTASQGLVATSLGDTGYGFNLWMSNSTSEGLRGDVPKNTSNQYITNVNEGSAWPDSNWHHVAFVSDGTTATLYRDGTSIATQALGSLATANQQQTTNVLLFGAYHSSSSAAGFLDGRIDDIRIFRRPITQSEITRLASKRGILGPALPEGLGDEGIWLAPTITGNNANIAKPMLAPTKYNGNAEVVASTGSGGSKAFEVGGGSERVNIDEVLSFQKDYPCTLSFWLKADSVSNSQRILGKRSASGSGVGWNLEISGNVLEMDAMSQSGWPYRLKVTASNLLTAATWHHLVITWDGSDANGWQLWVDGVKKTWTVDGNNGNNFPSSSNMRTSADFVFGGRDTSTSNTYVGQFDDIRVYRRIIEAAEISHLSASRGASGKPKSYKAVINESVTYSPLQKQSTTQYCTQTNIAGTLSDTNSTGRFVEGPTKNLSNAIKFNSSYSRKIAFSSVPSGLAGMTKYTVSAWVKGQISSTAQRTVVAFEGTASSRSYRFTTHVSASTQKGPSFFHANSQIVNRNTLDNTNKWQHVVVTVDTTNGTRQTYIDGQLDLEATGTAYDAVYSTLNYLAIGAKTHGGAGEYHDAAIAGVGIWDKILTPQEINSLYSEYAGDLVGIGKEKLWILPSRTGDRSNVMYPAEADTELNGSLSIVDAVSDGGTKAISFNQSSSSNYLEWDDNTASDPVTISFWLDGSNLWDAYDRPALIGKSGSSALKLYTDPNDNWGAGTLGFSGDSNWYTGDSWAGSYGQSEWHHVAVVRDYQTNTKFYVDGSLVHTGSADDTTAGAWDAAAYFIGVDQGAGDSYTNFYGKIDDLRVIDGAATASEIGWLSQSRGMLGAPSITADTGSFTITGNAAQILVPISMSAGTAAFAISGKAAHFNWAPPGLGSEIMWVCPTYSGDRSNLISGQNATGTGGTLSVVDDTSEQGLRAFDCTVTNNNSNYWTFNLGSSRNPCTLSFWIKRTSTGGHQQIICAQSSSSNTLQVMLMSSTDSASNTDELYFWNDGAGSNSGTAINGTWHHVLMERNYGGTNRFFLDGVAYGSYSGNAGGSSNSFGGTMRFVASPNHSNGAYNIIGRLDDVRIIPGTLATAEITHLASRRGVQGPANTSTTMSAATGAFSFSFPASNLGPKLNATVQTFAVTFPQFPLVVELEGSVQTYAIAFPATTLGPQLDASVQTFALAFPQFPLVTELEGSVQTYSITVNAADLRAARVFEAGAGSFQISVNNAPLSVVLNDAVNSYAINVNNADLVGQTKIDAGVGAFQIDVKAADLIRVTNLSASTAAYAITVRNSELAPTLKPSATAFAITVNAITTSTQASLSAATGAFAFTFYTVITDSVTVFSVSEGTFTIGTFPAERGDGIAARTESYAISVNDATLRGITPIAAQKGTFQTAFSAIKIDVELNVSVTEYAVTVPSPNFEASGNRKINADTAVFATSFPMPVFITRLGLVNETVPYSIQVAAAEQSRPAQTGAFAININRTFPEVIFRPRVANFQFTVYPMDWTPAEFIPNSFYYRFLMQGK